MMRIWHTRRNWGHTALGIWLIAAGLLPLLGITVPYSGQLLAVLAVAAGVLILMQR
jgi:hypothetical protein